MKKLGLLGGMSWESSIEYERLINRGVREALGGTNSADLLIRSFNFADIERLQIAGEWEKASDLLANAAHDLENSGAEAILLCTNTMHVLAPQILKKISIPFLHIVDAVGEAIVAKGVEKTLLLGTKYTMEKDFYSKKLREEFHVESIIPDSSERDEIQRIIYEELVQGVINPASRSFMIDLIEKYQEHGIQGVIAGCTEIELLVKPEDIALPYFPTTAIHVAAATAFALNK